MRLASRALILSSDGYVLLVRFVFPHGVFWAMPGGGKEDHESYEECLTRELTEEVGLTNPEIGPVIWTRKHVIPIFGKFDGQIENIYLVRVEERFEPRPAMTVEELQAENLHEVRWWSLEELLGMGNKEEVRFIPLNLPDLVRGIITNGPPTDGPVHIGE